MKIVDKVIQIITPSLEGMGFSIVKVQFFGVQKKTLQVIIRRLDEKPVTILDCTHASRSISLFLSVDNTINYSYTLEISSPGIKNISLPS